MMKRNTEIELPPHVVDLLDSHNENLTQVQMQSLNLISTLEISVFNGLRNLTSEQCLKALDRMDILYDGNIQELILALTVLTEYMCIAFRNTNFYKTFRIDQSKKYTETLFNKLRKQWMGIYRNENLSSFVNTPLFKYSIKTLKYSIEQFSTLFIHKQKLRETLLYGEELIYVFESRAKSSINPNTTDGNSRKDRKNPLQSQKPRNTPSKSQIKVIPLLKTNVQSTRKVCPEIRTTPRLTISTQLLTLKTSDRSISKTLAEVESLKVMELESPNSEYEYSANDENEIQSNDVRSKTAESENFRKCDCVYCKPNGGDQNNSVASKPVTVAQPLEKVTTKGITIVDLTKEEETLLEPPKKKVKRNAFDILMKKKAIRTTI